MLAKKGDWVKIHYISLKSNERSNNLPEETKRVPFEIRIKGFLLNDKASIGDEVEIETIIGRKIKGNLEFINPIYDHDFGEPVYELLNIRKELKVYLEEGEIIEQ